MFVKPNSYSLSVVSESKVLKYLNALSVDKATGLDGIPSRFVRDSASIIVCPLTHIINYLSFKVLFLMTKNQRELFLC